MAKTETKRIKPRLVKILAVFLFLETPILLALGLNLFTENWAFLRSWTVLMDDVAQAFRLVTSTPGSVEMGETLFYGVIAAVVLTFAAAGSLLSGFLFLRSGAFAWILSLMVQIVSLLTGLILYFLYEPVQSYALMIVGVFMVLYLNYNDVRIWFLQSERERDRENHVTSR